METFARRGEGRGQPAAARRALLLPSARCRQTSPFLFYLVLPVIYRGVTFPVLAPSRTGLWVPSGASFCPRCGHSSLLRVEQKPPACAQGSPSLSLFPSLSPSLSPSPLSLPEPPGLQGYPVPAAVLSSAVSHLQGSVASLFLLLLTSRSPKSPLYGVFIPAGPRFPARPRARDGQRAQLR